MPPLRLFCRDLLQATRSFPYCRCDTSKKNDPLRITLTDSSVAYKGQNWACFKVTLDSTVCGGASKARCCSSDFFKLEFNVGE